nr:uncharacterized mitochondrial protein AtMg00810-like [Tanacetum cinerariifolium]
MSGEADVIKARERSREVECEGLRVKCKAAMAEFDHNHIVLALREKISSLTVVVKEHKDNLDRMMLEAVEASLRKEVEELKQDRRDVVSKVVPYAVIKLVHSNKLGRIVGKLVSFAITYGRCRAYEQVAAMKEPFDLSTAKGYHSSYQKDHTQTSNDFATTMFPWLDEFVADTTALIETMLSKKPPMLQKPALSRTQIPVAMISTRLKNFYKKTGRKLHFDAKEPIGFDKTKVECFNCHNTRHFPRECKSKGNQESVDWTGHAEDHIENYALMAFNSSNSSSNTEGFTCSLKSDFRIDESKFIYGPKQSITSESDVKTNNFDSCESNSSVETLESVPEPVESKPKAISEPKDNPHQTLKGKGIVNSRCSRHMTRNKAYLVDYQDFIGGLVAFGGSKGQITSKVSTACYVLNRVLVTKPQNKTPYELLTGKIPIISYIRPFGCHVTILNTIDHLRKFEEKSNEGYLVGYSLNSKAFRVYNLETKRVEENLHINFLKNKPNVAGKGPTWLFDLDYLTDSMNYHLVTTKNKANKTAEYYVLPLWSSYTSTVKSSKAKNGDVKLIGGTGSKTNGEPIDQEDQAFLEELESLKRQAKEADDAAETLRKTFAKSKIDEEVYVSQPPGFIDPKFPKKVYKVVKALYGLHQALRAWYATLSTFLVQSGYKGGLIDKTLFIKKDKKDIMLVQVYVDDIIFGSIKKSWCDEFKALMKSRFQMSSMGELTIFLGLQVKQKEDEIFISQDKYVAKILKKFDFMSVKTASTLIETKKPLVKDAKVTDVDVHLYRSMIGSLMYLTASKPDIMYAVCACSRFQVTPKTSHLHAVKRIFRYLKGQPTLGLWYPRESTFDLEAYSDSDYAGANLDMKSTTGGC